MTPEVKQRIEQIRQGIVPEGYKKTKSDIVPVDWKESSIGEYICEYTEKTTIPNQYPVLTSARTGLMLQTKYYSNRQVTTENNVGYNILPFGYVTFRSRSDDGRFRFNENRIIKRGIISYFYPVFSFSEEVCHEYMLYLLNFSIYRRMYSYAEGTAQQVLSLKKLGQLKYSLPPVREQKKIAEILSTQDKAIELQGRKIEELKRFKQGCLERMFPRKGRKVPEKRFPGFTDDWEQRKVSDVADICTGGTPSTSIQRYWFPKEIPWLSSGEVHKKYITFTDNEISIEGMNNSSARIISENSVLIALAGQGKTRGTVAINRIPLTTNQSIASMTFCKQVVPEFVFCNLESRYDEIRRMSSGDGSRGGLNKQIVGDIEIPYTSTDEQRLIGTFFESLDHLITLHQRKLEEMKRQKKALMQLLLTGIVRVKA